MNSLLRQVRRFLAELKRRNVYRVAVAYLAAAFVGLQALDLLVPATALPRWASSLFVAIAVMGFPVALVLAWAFELTPEGVRRTRSAAEGIPESARGETGKTAVWIGAAAVVVLAAAALWWSDRADRSPPAAASSGAAVAVLPFTAFGPGVEHLGEGMVSLLSTALDGAGGVRAIDQRTVLSRWDRTLGAGGEPDRSTALAVARSVGARWAVLGSVTTVGREARVEARLLRSETGERAGAVRVEGDRDSLLTMIDDLTRRVLEVLVRRTGVEATPVPMASLTTRSLQALKAFLEGERLYRHGQMDSALAAYRRATDEDSTFALAWLRRAVTYGWATQTWLEPGSVERAYALRLRLPERARLAVVGAYLLGRNDRRAADTLELATRTYPDDPELWYWLGETYFHHRACRSPEETERTFARATDLNPDIAPYWIHPIQLALGYHRDSAMALRRIEAMARAEAVPSDALFDPSEPTSYPGFHLLFGTRPVEERVEAYLTFLERHDTEVVHSSALYLTRHPSSSELDHALWLAAARRDPGVSGRIARLLMSDAASGRLDRWLRDEERFDAEGRIGLSALVTARSQGVPIPDTLLRRQLRRVMDLEARSGAEILVRSLAALAIDDSVLESRARRSLAEAAARPEADSAQLALIEKRIDAYGRWLAGDERGALDVLLHRETGGVLGPPPQLWLADLYRATGELEKAARCYRSQWTRPVAYMRLGQVYDRMGRKVDALHAYHVFLDVWKDASPELRGFAGPVRERVVELEQGAKPTS